MREVITIVVAWLAIGTMVPFAVMYYAKYCIFLYGLVFR